MNSKVYGYVTERIVAALEAGTIPWEKPWDGGATVPANLVSKKPYRGVNAFLLALAYYPSRWFLSRKQIKDRGGQIRKGEKGWMIVFYTTFTPKNAQPKKNGDLPTIPVLRYYYVWNVAQCEGLTYPEPKQSDTIVSPIECCEAVWDGYSTKPDIETGNLAAYSDQRDVIIMPDMQLFNGPEEWYSTLFHEAVHSTGHKDRLGRDLSGSFGTGSYSREELVAELGAAFLCGHTGIETKTIDNSAAYIASWIRKLKTDEKLIVQAASRAQKAADYILGMNAQTTTDSDAAVAVS